MSTVSEVLERGRLVRAQSAQVLSRAASQSFSIRPRRSVSLTRVSAYRPASVDVSRDMWMTEKYRPRAYRRDYELYDDYWHDRYYYMTPYYWSTYRYARRNQIVDSPSTLSMWGYSGRNRWYNYDTMDPFYWRRYRDPYYDRPLWYGSRPWAYESIDAGRALDMYKRGLISFSALDKYWLEPTEFDRRTRYYWRDLYIPTGLYGNRRYFYSFA